MKRAIQAPKICTEFAHAGACPPILAGEDHQGRKIYHVLHEREGYPLSYWFTYNPAVVQSGWRIHPDHFDVRDIPNPFRSTVTHWCFAALRDAGCNLALHA